MLKDKKKQCFLSLLVLDLVFFYCTLLTLPLCPVSMSNKRSCPLLAVFLLCCEWLYLLSTSHRQRGLTGNHLAKHAASNQRAKRGAAL